MIRSFKALGVLLTAALAIGAVIAASGTEATNTPKFRSDGDWVTYDATGGDDTLTINGGTLTCKTIHYHGKQESAVEATELPTMTLHPTFTNCTTTALGSPATVSMNACDLKFRVADTDGGSHKYKGSVDLECMGGSAVTIDLWISEKSHKEMVTPPCTVEIPPQSNIKTIKYNVHTTPGPKNIVVEGTLEGITYKMIKNNAFAMCPGVPGELRHDGVYHITSPVTLIGTNAKGEETDLWIG